MSEQKPPMSNQILRGEEQLLLDHNYDGIQELDHPLPRWWIWTFYLTIIFSIFYMGYYMVGSGPGSIEELATAMSEIEALRPAVPPTSTEGGDAQLLAALTNPEKIKQGSEIYMGKCMPCHGDKGQGVIGPNLVDEYWVHGNGTAQDTAQVVLKGVPDKGMPPWEALLTLDEVHAVVAFVHSIYGSNPPGAKPPQGEKKIPKVN